MVDRDYARPFPQVPRKEVYRYLGYRGATPEEDIQARVEGVVDKLQQAAQPRMTYQRLPLRWQGDKAAIAGFALEGEDIHRNLLGCQEAFLVAATLGGGTDRLITRLALSSAADMVLLQAVAAAALEEMLDQEEKSIKQRLLAEGFSLRPRYSPGYGDLPLTMQPCILQALNAPKLIGLSVTDSLMLTPQKSVTALAGICALGEERVVAKGCRTCNKKDCALRQEEDILEDR